MASRDRRLAWFRHDPGPTEVSDRAVEPIEGNAFERMNSNHCQAGALSLLVDPISQDLLSH